MQKFILTLVLLIISVTIKAQDQTINGATFKSSGFVGIGTTTPSAALHLTDPGTSGHTTLQLNSRIKFRGDGVMAWGANAEYGLLSWGGMNTLIGAQNGKNLTLLADGSVKLTINVNGNVGIGTTNPGTWKLAVNGQIRAKEIKVETDWSDFVFEETYKLPTLKEVEKHIKEKGHLKDIPSAKDVAKNGIYLGEMDSKLLQKIEELTLYTIEQQKEIVKLKVQVTEIELLKKELKNILEELKKQK